MSRYGVTPNMLVLPPQMLLYMALAPEQKLTYKVCSQRSPSHARAPTLTLTLILYQEGGPAAEARFEAGVAGFEARSFRGCGVVTSGARTRARAPFPPLAFRVAHPLPLAACAQSPSRSRTVRDDAAPALRPRAPLTVRVRACADADSVQMLTRSSQIGEFYVMSPPQVQPADGKFTCDLLIYDEESDRHVRITWRDALKATLVDTATGDVGGQGVTTMAGGGGDSKAWVDQAENWAKYSEGSGGSWDASMLDCRIVVARPFIEHLMVRRRPLS